MTGRVTECTGMNEVMTLLKETGRLAGAERGCSETELAVDVVVRYMGFGEEKSMTGCYCHEKEI